ncbi:site-specific integrase [Paenibacillus melissococcoides]|uniref:Site-specific integrase n=1 Tax=Paenibacillus melissococcoides TaxID=2912268 RepID=A0ABM9G998_9BACL|nr:MULTISPECIES: site-specific integrase [Paenibacillus]MEB9896775.1 site-specific integrase [Bacillus cereus]CAH8248606.1 site-specific integrase [Paenibacillus melissococcoides]CAH8714267.1 site-specific integrase [Paenibacillus melissococcoides]CAH8719965.1 site-specific integrase [Paenibacillus melissococcoides]GIO79563.1 site-specific integrase [Paenibacillus dendritiformis]
MNVVQPIRDPELLQDILDFLESTNYRNYIMFLIGIDTGLRISDILRLRVRDVAGSHITIREKKTGKQKRILITTELKQKLAPYIEGKPPNEFLIKSREGLNRPITREMAYKIIRAVGDEFGLSEIGCHTLRKTFGYIFYNVTTKKDIALLMNYFNHSSTQETLRYIGMTQDTMDMALKRHRR